MVTGQVLGRAGGSLENATWAKNDAVTRVGKAGEVSTAAVLDGLAHRQNGPTVMHDLNIPIPRIRANIDHVVVTGRVVHLIDAKVWKPGFYWTVRGTTRRGWSKFAPADKKTMPMAVDAVTRFLAARGVKAVVARPLLVVWPSSRNGTTSMWALVSPGARVVTGAQFTRRAARLTGTKPADPAVVAALTGLVIGLNTATPVMSAQRSTSIPTDPFNF